GGPRRASSVCRNSLWLYQHSLLHLGNFPGRVFDGIDNVGITGAAAEVAFDGVADLFAGRFRVPLKQLDGHHDHAGRAIAALQAVTFPEPFLDRMQSAVCGQTFNRSDLRTVGLDGEQGAGLHCLALEENSASPADARLAADVCARQPAAVAEEMDEQRSRLDLVTLLEPVDADVDDRLHVAIPRPACALLRSFNYRWPLSSGK